MRTAIQRILIISILLIAGAGSFGLVVGQVRIPFDGLHLVYFSETTQTVQERTGMQGNWWTSLTFDNVTDTSSLLSINVNGTVTQGNQQQPQNFNSTVNFPTDRDTLIFLRNGGQDNLTIFAGPSGVAIPAIPGLTVDLTRQWDLHDKPLIRTPLGAFSSYRYHTAIKSIGLPMGGTLDLDFYAAYEVNTQVLIQGEVWATINGASAMIAHTEIREANFPSNQKPSGCFIATATYGSEVAPQVQFLRAFRDQKIDTTFAGASFMIAFNTWYYSFSPTVASGIQSNSILQGLMRLVIYPLLLIIEASATLFDTLSSQPEIGALISGLFASAMIGIIYLGVPGVLIRRRFRVLADRGQKALVIALGTGLVGLTIAEIITNSELATLSSTTVILANLLVFASLPSQILNLVRRAGKMLSTV